MATRIIHERKGFEKLLESYESESVRKAPGMLQFRIKAFHNEAKIWEYKGLTGQVVPDEGEKLSGDVLNALDLCGARKLMTSFSRSQKATDSLGKCQGENRQQRSYAWFQA